jgi:diguanylate cyclase (GGDEF)-like protein
MLRRKAEPAEPAAPLIPTDAATGLPDRTNLGPWLTEAARRAQADSSRVALTFLELGGFSDVSDTYGPDMSDEVLATVGQRLRDSLDPGQEVCRFYGAEFAIVTPGVNSVERATELSEEALDVLSQPVTIGPGMVTTSTAAGVALSDTGYASTDEWLQDAHEALTEARTEGHLACVVHDESTRNRVDVRITQDRVLKGWDQSEFYLMYQPIVRAADNTIAGFEALLRWRDPGASGTFISPAHFVYLLERLGLMVPVGAWAIREATTTVKYWNDHYPDRQPIFVSVNLGARQLAQRAFADTVVEALDASGLDRELLVLDVTDECLKFNKGSTWKALRGLKYLGVRAGLDDFGIGEVGMNYLREMQVDFLTVHRSFLEGVGQIREDTAIVRSVIELGRELEIATIAEGIENDDQDALIREIGPDLLQGFYYGRPELAETTEELLATGPTIEGSEDWKMKSVPMAEWPEAYGDGRADADGDAEGETELPDPPT